MYGQWLNKVLNGLRNIHRWEGRQKIGHYDDSYPGAFYRINHSCTENHLYILERLG